MATGEMIALGGALGTVVPGIGNIAGAAIGGIIGAGIDIFNWFTGQSDKQKQQNLETATKMAEGKAKLTELTTKQGAYQDFLTKVPVAGEALKGTTGDLAFDQSYRALLENYGNANVMAGMRGQVSAGSSGGVVAAQQQDIMGGFVTAEKQKAEQQLTILGAGIESTKAGMAALDTAQHSGGLFGQGGFLGTGWGA
jgi:hypothetical protein